MNNGESLPMKEETGIYFGKEMTKKAYRKMLEDSYNSTIFSEGFHGKKAIDYDNQRTFWRKVSRKIR